MGMNNPTVHVETIPISLRVKKRKFKLYETLRGSGFEFKENDILVISSKFVSMSQGSLISLNTVKASKRAKTLAWDNHMSEEIVELTLREGDYVFRGVPGFLLTFTDGILSPNAGIDKSNAPRGFVILYPSYPFETAENLRRRFLIDLGINIMIVIADSRLMPGRIGTIGVAIANAGFEPTEDQRGNKDLFGRLLRVSFRAVSDSLATTAVAVMGEGDESIPAAVIRGLSVTPTDRRLSWRDTAVYPAQDLYLRGLLS
ncbi:MAG TPA: coenzyme F420-0:L-glutamate ligase [Candidatus Nitrosopolaris sp.]|nr:coenzyme F420-0:L-glutamate ligase [Candidatus Nitrosopolaris sp.]